MDERRFIGGIGWAGLFIYVALWDLWACVRNKETLSGAYYRAMTDKRSGASAILVTALITKHLVFPKFLPQIDPLHKFAEVATKRLHGYPNMKASPNDSSLLPG